MDPQSFQWKVAARAPAVRGPPKNYPFHRNTPSAGNCVELGPGFWSSFKMEPLIESILEERNPADQSQKKRMQLHNSCKGYKLQVFRESCSRIRGYVCAAGGSRERMSSIRRSPLHCALTSVVVMAALSGETLHCFHQHLHHCSHCSRLRLKWSASGVFRQQIMDDNGI